MPDEEIMTYDEWLDAGEPEYPQPLILGIDYDDDEDLEIIRHGTPEQLAERERRRAGNA